MPQRRALRRAQTRAGPRPGGLATRRPAVAAARTQFVTVLTATRNRAASTAALPSPCSWATAPARANPPNKAEAWSPPQHPGPAAEDDGPSPLFRHIDPKIALDFQMAPSDFRIGYERPDLEGLIIALSRIGFRPPLIEARARS